VLPFVLAAVAVGGLVISWLTWRRDQPRLHVGLERGKTKGLALGMDTWPVCIVTVANEGRVIVTLTGIELFSKGILEPIMVDAHISGKHLPNKLPALDADP